MAFITFMSDFGERDHYVAAVKAAILGMQPAQQIIDISHHIDRHDIGHAAYVMRKSYTLFPNGTVHLIAVDSVLPGTEKLVAVELNGHFFVGHDTGIYYLIHQESAPLSVRLESQNSTFPARDALATAAVKLANGTTLASLGPAVPLQVKVDRQLKATKREMVGQVVHIDHFGNLITNITKKDFDAICLLHGGNPAYNVRFAHEQINQLHKSYSDVDDADCFVLFNSDGFLEIGLRKARAAQLLAMKLDSPVMIEFNPD